MQDSESPASTADYPIRPVPFTQVHIEDGFWHPPPRDQPHQDHPVRLQEVRGDRSHRQLRRRRRTQAGAPRRHLLQRLRRLQGHRRRQLLPRHAPGPGARPLPRRADRRHRGRPRGRRLPLHGPYHRCLGHGSHAGRARTMEPPRAQPRALQCRAPLRSRRGPLRGDRQAHPARRRRQERGPHLEGLRPRSAPRPARPPGDRARPRPSLARDRPRSLPRARPVLPRPTRPSRHSRALRRVCAGPSARHRSNPPPSDTPSAPSTCTRPWRTSPP